MYMYPVRWNVSRLRLLYVWTMYVNVHSCITYRHDDLAMLYLKYLGAWHAPSDVLSQLSFSSVVGAGGCGRLQRINVRVSVGRRPDRSLVLGGDILAVFNMIDTLLAVAGDQVLAENLGVLDGHEVLAHALLSRLQVRNRVRPIAADVRDLGKVACRRTIRSIAVRALPEESRHHVRRHNRSARKRRPRRPQTSHSLSAAGACEAEELLYGSASIGQSSVRKVDDALRCA